MKKKVYREKHNILQESINAIWDKKLNDTIEELKPKKPTKKKVGKK